MAKVNKYDWIVGVNTPKLDEHSKVKLDIIERYLEIYLMFLTKSCKTRTLKLNIIDGFAGGGIYKCETTGSPIRIKSAVDKAIRMIKFKKEQDNCPPIEFNIDYRFIEKNINTFNFLEKTLKDYGYYCEKTKCINGEFIKHIDNLINEIQNKSRAQRSIFVLDQYGYADAPLPVINKIFKQINNAEVILTFSVDSLIDYINRENHTVLTNMGLSKEDCERILDVREDNEFTRSKIQPLLYSVIVNVVGAKYYTPFFIKSDVTNRAYWLFHFSSHPTAKDEMMKLHWDSQNTFQHFGNPGLDMLIGFDSSRTENLFKAYEFDDFAKQQSLDTLSKEVPKLLRKLGNIKYEDFRNSIINETPATNEMIKESLTFALESRDIEIIAEDGSKRHKFTTIKDTDYIKQKIGTQYKLF